MEDKKYSHDYMLTLIVSEILKDEVKYLLPSGIEIFLVHIFIFQFIYPLLIYTCREAFVKHTNEHLLSTRSDAFVIDSK